MAITSVFSADSYGEGVWPSAYKVYTGEIAGPASYATNGFTADVATDLEVTTANIKHAIVTSDAGYSAAFNGTWNKIVAYASGGTEVTATTDLSSVTFTLTLFVSDE